MTDDKKNFRTLDTLTLFNVRVMVVGEPRTVGSGDNEKTLCSAKVVSQPGNERDMDCWITFTGSNALGEKIFNLKKGDRVNVSGKPFFGAYVDKDGVARPTVEIKFPDFVQVLTPTSAVRPTTDEAPNEEPVVEEETVEEETVKEKPVKRGPGRPRKQLPFE